MKTINRKLTLALLLLALLCAALPALAAQTDARIFDQAELFNAAEEAELAFAIEEFTAETGMDFAIITTSASHGDYSVTQIADDFYDQYGFGTGDEHSGGLLYIDMYGREYAISSTGEMKDYITNNRLDSLKSSLERYLRVGGYYQASVDLLDNLTEYIREGVPEGQYQYDIVTGKQLTARHRMLKVSDLLIAAVAGLVVLLCVYGAVSSRYKLKGRTYHYDYAENSDVELTEREDNFLRTTTMRARKARPPSSGSGGGGFGGGNGTGIHIGSSGTAHGGGSGHF